MANERKPRVAIVTQDTANLGGVGRLVRYFYDRCEAVGFEPEILHYASFKKRPHLSVSLANFSKVKFSQSLGSERYQFEGMRARAIGAYFPEWEPNRISMNSRWKRELQEFDAFFLITGSAHVGYPFVKAQVPFVSWVSATVDEDRRARLERPASFAERLEKISLGAIKRSERAVLRRSARVLAVSEDTKKHLTEFLGARKPIDVFPFPVNTEIFTAKDREYSVIKPRVLFVGRAGDARKNITLFFDAVRQVRQQESFPPIAFTVVSTLDLSPSVREKYSDVLPHVEFATDITDAQLVELYRTSTALVITSEQEGLGIAAMEALSCGTPVISTRCGGPETFLTESCGFFTGFTAEEIAGRIVAIASNEELFERLGRYGSAHIEKNFSEHGWNTRFEQLIQQQVKR